jgi:hypothetical protein
MLLASLTYILDVFRILGGCFLNSTPSVLSNGLESLPLPVLTRSDPKQGQHNSSALFISLYNLSHSDDSRGTELPCCIGYVRSTRIKSHSTSFRKEAKNGQEFFELTQFGRRYEQHVR